MSTRSRLDCVVIGYNEPPFAAYETLIRQYGINSEAYRDLQFSFVDLDSRKLTYMDLLNEVYAAVPPDGRRTGLPLRSGDIPNLAAVYLTTYLRRRGCAATFINLFQYEKDRLADLLAHEPLAVAITTTFYVLNQPVTEMVSFIRSHNPRTRIIVGGPLVANHARNYLGAQVAPTGADGSRVLPPEHPFRLALEDMGADIFVVESQGEQALYETVCCLRAGDDLSRVRNLVYVSRAGMTMTAVQAENNPIDENGVDWKAHADEGIGPTVQTRTARSCAFSCAFCNYPTRAGALTLASLSAIEREMDALRELGVANVVFIDDTFNVPLARFKDICRLFISKRYGFQWFSYFRCSNSDDEAVDLMAESGCTGVFLGIESGSPVILKNMHKAATIDKYARGIERLRANGVLTFASLIIGFPGETDETVRDTAAFIRSTSPEYFRAQLWYCEAGTPIEQQREWYGIDGQGFVWSHRTMDSVTAMDHIDTLCLSMTNSIWLPQWSFDFWAIPYLVGKGVSLPVLKRQLTSAHELLKLEIASVRPQEKATRQRELFAEMVRAARHGGA
jgi:p-methyltransferase